MRLRRISLLFLVSFTANIAWKRPELNRDKTKQHHQDSGDFHLDEEAAQYFYVNGIGPSPVNILMYVWTKGANYDAYLQTIDHLTLAILDAVRKSGANASD